VRPDAGFRVRHALSAQIQRFKPSLKPTPLCIHSPNSIEGGTVLKCLNFCDTNLAARIYQHKLAALEDLKKSLLHEAFNGRL